MRLSIRSNQTREHVGSEGRAGVTCDSVANTLKCTAVVCDRRGGPYPIRVAHWEESVEVRLGDLSKRAALRPHGHSSRLEKREEPIGADGIDERRQLPHRIRVQDVVL